MYVDSGLQIIAFNPPEPVPTGTLIKRGLVDIGQEDIRDKQPGSHKTGLLDMVQAGLQLVTSPVSSARTIGGIGSGYSSTRKLAWATEQFPAGRAIVHSELDAFQFPKGANLEAAALYGVSTAVIPNHWHNEILFAPNRTLTAVMPHILPEVELATD